MKIQGHKEDFKIVKLLMEKLTMGSRMGIYRRINEEK